MPKVNDEALEIARRIALYKAMGDYSKAAAWQSIHDRTPKFARVVSDRRVEEQSEGGGVLA